MVDEATWRAAACGAVAGVCAVQVFQVPKLAHLDYYNITAILCVCVLVPIPLSSSLSARFDVTYCFLMKVSQYPLKSNWKLL